ncbi:hypothetical protein B296_00051743, partial [Ensete ventricosum]
AAESNDIVSDNGSNSRGRKRQQQQRGNVGGGIASRVRVRRSHEREVDIGALVGSKCN